MLLILAVSLLTGPASAAEVPDPAIQAKAALLAAKEAAHLPVFVTMSFVLGGAVILLINLEGGKSYPGYTIYVAAAYAFTKISLAIWNTVSAGRKKEQSWIIIRSIGLADAAVSILSLQTAMFASFSIGKEAFNSTMNGITGAVVSLITLVTGIFYLAASRGSGTERRNPD